MPKSYDLPSRYYPKNNHKMFAGSFVNSSLLYFLGHQLTIDLTNNINSNYTTQGH